MATDDKLRRRYVYITDQQWQKLRERAAARGITMSAYLRSLIEKAKS